MKKYIKSLAWIAAFVFAVVSCQEKIQPHEPGEPDASGCYGVYFPSQDASGMHVYSPVQDPSVEITVKRTNTSGAITVPVQTSFSEEGIFTVTDVSFADGQDETTFTVRFDSAQEGTTYTASFLVDDKAYASMYNSGPVALDFSVMRVQMKDFMTEDGSKKAAFTFTDKGFWEEAHDEVYIQYYEVDGVRYCQTSGGKLLEYYGQSGSEGTGPWGTDVQMTFKWYPKKMVEIDGEEYEWVEVTAQPHGWSSGDNPVYFGDFFHMRADMGLGNGDFTNSYDRYTKGTDGYLPSYYDGHGGFIFNMAYWIHGTTSWYGYQDNAPVAIAEGYTRVDYTLELESDYSYDGVSPINITAGIDVANIKYAVYEGELTATQIANKIDAILDGSEATTEFSEFEVDEEAAAKYATLELAPETTGMYTFVAVAYDKDKKAQNSGSATFKHIAADDVEDHEVELSVFTEDTPERYKNYHAYDSFAYCIAGEDLTDVHVGIFKSADLEESGDKILNAVKRDEEGDYAVSEDILAQINGEGGYYTVATKMPAKTELVVVVWGTNGDMDSFVFDTYKTAPLPYVWNKLGTGVYTEDVAGGIYQVGPIDIACNVYEEAATPGLYMIDGFQKNYIDLLFKAGAFGDDMVEEDVADYEDMLWRNSELVIDATDPENVFIELQDYGICLNPGEGFIDGLTSMFEGEPFSVGTLKDGVISFPTKKGMLATIGGQGYYYANQDGAFKVVLPEKEAEPKANNGKKSIKSLNGKSFFKPMGKEVFERDPQPVKVTVKVKYTRKENNQPKENAKVLRSIR